MSEQINIFQRVLERYKFQEPMSADMQKYMLTSKRDMLLQTLKSVGEYGFFYGLVLRVFFGAKRIGISLSVVQSAIVTGIISMIIILSIAAGVTLLIADRFDRSSVDIENINETIIIDDDRDNPSRMDIPP